MITKTEFEEYVVDVLRAMNSKFNNLDSKINKLDKQIAQISSSQQIHDENINAQTNQILENLKNIGNTGITSVVFTSPDQNDEQEDISLPRIFTTMGR